MKADASTSGGERAPIGRGPLPKLGLRFDRGRTELVLDAPLSLPGGPRLEAMRTELAPREGSRLSLSEGWRAFRHRRSTLVEATLSIALGDLASLLGARLGLPTSLVALSAQAASVAVASEAMALAADLEWGFDGEDLVVAVRAPRSLPLAPRSALALVVDLASTAGASFDRERGVLRFARPMRAALLGALIPAGIRLPSTAGLTMHAWIEGDRLRFAAEAAPGGRPEASRAALERARADAPIVAECIEHDGPPPDDLAPVALTARALHAAMGADEIDPAELERTATEYAARERHPAMASKGLLLAADRAGDRAWRLALGALERGGLTRPTELARAVELAALGGLSSGTQPPWERLARTLDGTGALVARARGLALERADRPAEALAVLSETLRADPDDRIALGGVARSLTALARHDEAISLWDRLASASEGEARDAARLSAAEAVRAAGHVDGAIARLRALVHASPPNDTTLAAQQRLASVLLSHVGLEAALEADRSLAALTDALGGLHALRSSSALRRAIDRALGANDVALARAHLAALERVLGDAGQAEYARLAASIAEAEQRSLAAGDPSTLRARAEALRAEGRTIDAARVLIELFAQTQDAAVLRAAIELADRSPEATSRRAVFDRALTLLPPGPARDAIAARR